MNFQMCILETHFILSTRKEIEQKSLIAGAGNLLPPLYNDNLMITVEFKITVFLKNICRYLEVTNV